MSPSLLGTLLQSAGVACIALLSFLLARSVRRPYVTYWAIGWGCMAVALFALFVSFRIARLGAEVQVLYYLGEYAFCFFLRAGARNYVSHEPISREDSTFAVLAVLAAIVFSRLPVAFDQRFAIHGMILAALFGVCLVRFGTLPREAPPRLGLVVIRVSLSLLVVDFFQYGPVLLWAGAHNATLPLAYAGYTALYDLILEVLLAFGMVTFVLEDVNRELQIAHDRLASLAQHDPLTQSLNRHAFYTVLEEEEAGGRSGTVAVLDVDKLKGLNDSLGHAAGDAAIRAVASAIRALVRAGDLVFRWGGDEFLVILPGVPLEEARRRFLNLDGRLADVREPLSGRSFPVHVSFGAARFGGDRRLESAIGDADAEMYGRKKARSHTSGDT